LRHFGARATDRFRLDDLRVVILENERLRLTFLPDKGCDLIELLYKPKDVDFLWRSPQGVRDPRRYIPSSSTARPFQDYYEGGWQELFPHAGAGVQYAGADLGFHGEVWGLPWHYVIERDDPDEVRVRFWVETVRTPFRLDRIVSLRSGEACFHFDETVENQGKHALQFMWGHHPAFGAPFLDRNCVIEAPAEQIEVGGIFQSWPVAADGTDHSKPGSGSGTREVMKYLHGFREGWVALNNPGLGVGIRLEFDPQVFKYVWLWHELGYTTDYPWFGRAYVLAIEPHSSLPGAHQSGGRLLQLQGGETLSTRITCRVL
jgi:galactose mutarotase-like enzyme